MNRYLAKAIQSAVKPQTIERLSEFQALHTFHRAAARVPAYRDLLQQLRVPVHRVWSIREFRHHVPLIDKQSYFRLYPLEMLCLDGRFDRKYTLERSSGYSGTPYFWLREPAEDKHLEDHVEFMFRDMFQAHRVPMLVVVTWSQGSWVTGEKFARTIRNLASRGKLKLTVVSPGLAMEEIQEILDTFMARFPQTLITGYPPFLKDIIDQAARRGIRWPDHRVHLISGGEGFPENWREYMATALGIRTINARHSGQIISCYGSADSGIGSGGETPFALLVRRLAAADRRLCAQLFGTAAPPSVFQYEPGRLWVESVDGELVLTYRSAMPLVRYNIHDRGSVLPFLRVCEVLKDHGYDPRRLLRSLGWRDSELYPIPFFCVHGRSDGTSTLYGVNIHTEDIQEALSDAQMVALHTGEFRVHTVFDQNAEQYLQIDLRLNAATEPSPAVARRIEDHLVRILRTRNSEYRHLHECRGTRVVPRVRLTHEPMPKGGGSNGFKNRYR